MIQIIRFLRKKMLLLKRVIKKKMRYRKEKKDKKDKKEKKEMKERK